VTLSGRTSVFSLLALAYWSVLIPPNINKRFRWTVWLWS